MTTNRTDRLRPARHAAAALAICLSAVGGASAQTEAQLEAMQIEAMADAPRLGSGTLSLPSDALADGEFVWLDLAEPGFYEITSTMPGALVLMSFATADGAFDGSSRPEQHLLAGDLSVPPVLGPVLLGTAHPYLLSVSAAEAASLTLRKVADIPPPVEDSDAPLNIGNHVFVAGDELDLPLSPSDAPLRVEVIPEARATTRAILNGEDIPVGTGLYPWRTGDADTLRMRSGGTGDTPVPLVLVRISEAPAGFDEVEPNDDTPITWSTDAPFRGTLLAGDSDLVEFALDSDQTRAFTVETDDLAPDFSVEIIRLDGSDQVPVWQRASTRGRVRAESLSLPAGTYRLRLDRTDAGTTAADYTLDLRPTAQPGGGHEVEPNDTMAVANRLLPGQTVRGSGGEQDRDLFAVSIPAASLDHLWRVFAVGADRVEILDRLGKVIEEQAPGTRRISIDPFLFDPSTHYIAVGATSDYALRLLDLGPRPEGFEAEPNDGIYDAQRLSFGAPATGGFHAHRDYDAFAFRLDAETAVRIEIEPPDTGRVSAWLYQDGVGFGGELSMPGGGGPVLHRAILPAGDWTLRLRSEGDGPWGSYGVTVAKIPAAGLTEPDDDLRSAAKLPRDGTITGTVGGLDHYDQVFVTLPRGSGDMIATCDSADDGLRWSFHDIRTTDGGLSGKFLTSGSNGLAAVPFDPDTGGALRLELEGTVLPGPYECAVRVLSGGWPGARPATLDEALQPGRSVVVPLTAEAEDIDLPLALSQGQVALAGCRLEDGTPLGTDPLRIRGADVLGDWSAEGLRLLRAGDAPLLRLYPDRAGRLPGTATCALFDALTLPGPGEAGPPAPFTPLQDGAAGNDAPLALRDLIARDIPDKQPRGALPVAFDLVPPGTFAAFSPAGQRADLSATLTNDGASDLELSLTADIAGDGWRVTVDPARARLAAGARIPVTLTLTAPPWLNPFDAPTLEMTARDESLFRSVAQPLTVATDVAPRDPQVVWQAHDALRGGLNVLHADLGATLVAIDGERTDERRREAQRRIHDGLAPHIGAPSTGMDLVFRLAARSRLAGAMIQLRSTDDPTAWPAGARFQTSTDGETWADAGTLTLGSTHAPQYAVFDAAREATHLRVRFEACRAPCSSVRLQEVQAIAVPGTHPAELSPINIAAPDLGGHVLYTLPNLTSRWNVDLLIPEERSVNTRWRPVAPEQTAVIGFNENRAARIEAIRWLGHPEDEERLPFGRVSASTGGPAGPWTPIGTLPSPPIGDRKAELRLPAPVWARYLRFDFDMPAAEGPLGPDAIEVIEAPGMSVLGLWEDDRQTAAFEAVTGTRPRIAAPPAGGASRDAAVPLGEGTPVTSSVQIERNADWWALRVPDGAPRVLELRFDTLPPAVRPVLEDQSGNAVVMKFDREAGLFRSFPLMPGDYHLQIAEPPRSVVVTWDTSSSVGGYIPRILAAVRSYGDGLVPGRDALNLLPFGSGAPLLDAFAETGDALVPALRDLPRDGSSAAEDAMQIVSNALADRPGAHGIIILTDGESPENGDLWPALLRANPTVVSLSIDSDTRQNAGILKDWAALNGGQFRRVTSPIDLAEGLDLAAALFRQPKGYRMTAALPVFEDPEGTATLRIVADDTGETALTGGIELVLDASGSMLQRIDGRRRIEVAHDALAGLVRDSLPEGTPFAFRAFGLQKDACLTELRVPLGPLDRDAAVAAIRGVPAINYAKTAIADSLRAAGSDLADTAPPRVIVLVTDGEETCDGDPEAEIRALRAAGLDVRVNIVGFAIDDEQLARTFSAWAAAGGGDYFAADGAEALEDAVSRALIPRFEVTRLHTDGTREALGQIALGDGAELPAGRLLITPAAGASGDPLELRLVPGADEALNYSRAAGLNRDR